MIVAVQRRLGPLGPTGIDPDEARDAACDATASTQVCDPPEIDADDLPDLDLPDPGAPAGVGLLGQILVTVLVAALLLAIVWMLIRWYRSRDLGHDDEVGESDRDEEIDEPIDARVVDHETPPERWRRRASEHRDAGRFRESIRCEYRALVGDLARAGYVDEIPGRTSGEERDQVARIVAERGEQSSAVTDAFGVTADTFDTAWFDDGAVTRDDDERFLAAQKSVLDTVLTGSRGGGRR